MAKKIITLVLTLLCLTVYSSPPKTTMPPGITAMATPKTNVSSAGDKNGDSDVVASSDVELWTEIATFSFVGVVFLSTFLFYKSMDNYHIEDEFLMNYQQKIRNKK